MKIYTRPWWYRWTIGLIFSITINNLFYTARMVNFFNHFSFLVKLFKFFGQDIRPAHQIWLENFASKKSGEIVPSYEERGEPKLATYIFEQESIAKEDRHYLIHCPGTSSQCARHFEELQEITRLTKTTTITFSHPGVGKSKGFVLDQDDLINAVFQQAKYLIDQGVPPRRITVSGMSMGAAAAVCAIEKINAYYQEKSLQPDSQEEKAEIGKPKQAVNYFGDRTFSDFTKEVVDQALLAIFHLPILKQLFTLPVLNVIEKVSSKILSYALWLPCKILLTIMNWDMQPQKHYDKLACAEKAVVYVKPRTLGEEAGWYKQYAKVFNLYRGHGDTRIRAHVSLKTPPKQKTAFKQELLQLQDELSSQQYKSAQSHVRELIRKNQTVNAIIHANLIRLQQELESKPEEQQLKKRFTKIVSAFKGERLQGIPRTGCRGLTDAHDARYQKMHPRQAGNKKWFFTNTLVSPEQRSNLVNYYARFDQAVRRIKK